eukprot:c9343_g1_i2.p1 GENE.c9343_g1_i2~~c9343_g1_i2.p1  ORF type:complete len:541 (+),score=109.09 c9343_g1_i2:39-1625(+)
MSTQQGKFKFDAFFSHDWGVEELNHKRVFSIAKACEERARGLRVWIDEREMTGGIVSKMCEGIDSSTVFVAFVTEQYVSKVNGDQENCKYEFDYAIQRKGPKLMIPVVLEESMQDVKLWKGPVGMILGGQLYVRLWDSDINTGVDKLIAEIETRRALLQPNPPLQVIAGREHAIQGQKFCCGYGEKLDYRNSIKCFERALNEGYAPASVFLARMYWYGFGCVKDVAKCRSLCEDNCVAIQKLGITSGGDELVQLAMGLLNYRGFGTEKNLPEAVRYFESAAQQGDGMAQYMIGGMYDVGEGVSESQEEAVKWYKRAVAKGHALAQHALGLIYLNSSVSITDHKKAIKLLTSSADQGYVDAQVQLGEMYDIGYGECITQDKSKAAKWYKKAIGQNDGDAQNNLAKLCEIGCDGVTQNIAEAKRLFELAAKKGHADAQYNLGRISSEESASESWYRLAAEQGHDYAQYNLGLIYLKRYENTRSNHQAKNEAVKWFKAAAEKGDEAAKVQLDRLSRQSITSFQYLRCLIGY